METEKLREQLAALSDAEQKISKQRDAACEPFNAALEAIDDITEALLEQHEAAIYGRCEFCSEIILVGEKGHSTDEGVLCEDCAPTWGDVKTNLEQARKDGDAEYDEQIESGLAAVAEHVATGGSLDEKCLHQF